jgi:hypothetical protein
VLHWRSFPSSPGALKISGRCACRRSRAGPKVIALGISGVDTDQTCFWRAAQAEARSALHTAHPRAFGRSPTKSAVLRCHRIDRLRQSLSLHSLLADVSFERAANEVCRSLVSYCGVYAYGGQCTPSFSDPAVVTMNSPRREHS